MPLAEQHALAQPARLILAAQLLVQRLLQRTAQLRLEILAPVALARDHHSTRANATRSTFRTLPEVSLVWLSPACDVFRRHERRAFRHGQDAGARQHHGPLSAA